MFYPITFLLCLLRICKACPSYPTSLLNVGIVFCLLCITTQSPSDLLAECLDWPGQVPKVFLRGDLDRNYQRDWADVFILQSVISNVAQISCQDWADVNDDGALNSQDINLLADIILQQADIAIAERKLGWDLTKDNFSCGDVPSFLANEPEEFVSIIESSVAMAQAQCEASDNGSAFLWNEGVGVQIWPEHALPGELPGPQDLGMLPLAPPGVYDISPNRETNGSETASRCCMPSPTATPALTPNATPDSPRSPEPSPTQFANASYQPSDSSNLSHMSYSGSLQNTDTTSDGSTDKSTEGPTEEKQCGGKWDLSITVYFPGITGTSLEGMSAQELLFILKTGNNIEAMNEKDCCKRLLHWITFGNSKSPTENATHAVKEMKKLLQSEVPSFGDSGGEVCGKDPDSVTFDIIAFSAGGQVAVDFIRQMTDSLKKDRCDCSDGARECPGSPCSGGNKIKYSFKLNAIQTPWEGSAWTLGTSPPGIEFPGQFGWGIGAAKYDPGKKPDCALCEMKFFVSGEKDASAGGKDPQGDSKFSDDWKKEIKKNTTTLNTAHTEAVTKAFPEGYKPTCGCKTETN